jgi:hypothetical protein
METIRMRARRAIAVAGFVGVLVAGTSVSANAAAPTFRGCFGQSVSTVAAPSRPFGNFVSDTARDPESRPGIGDAVQQVQAGQVDDADFPNTCN